MRFHEYEDWLEREHAAIETELEPGCVQVGPFLTPTEYPDSPPWKMEWAVIFPDGNFFRVTENWFARTTSLIRRGERKHFSFHYGPANPLRDAEGLPVRSQNYPAIFRADCDRHSPHLHFAGEDHVGQGRVAGLRIDQLEPFDFARAILKYRATGDGFDTILKFKVTT
jgi:hypothetical protein